MESFFLGWTLIYEPHFLMILNHEDSFSFRCCIRIVQISLPYKTTVVSLSDANDHDFDHEHDGDKNRSSTMRDDDDYHSFLWCSRRKSVGSLSKNRSTEREKESLNSLFQLNWLFKWIIISLDFILLLFSSRLVLDFENSFFQKVNGKVKPYCFPI